MTEVLDKQEIREKGHSFSRRKAVIGVFLDFCCKEHGKQYLWHEEQRQTGLILGLKHQRMSPIGVAGADAARVPQQRHQGWPCYHPERRTTCARMWYEEQPAICLFQDSTRISSEVTACLSVLFLLPCPALISGIRCSPTAKRNMVLCTGGAEICLVFARWEKSLSLLLCFPTVGSSQTRGSSIRMAPAERGCRWSITCWCTAGG